MSWNNNLKIKKNQAVLTMSTSSSCLYALIINYQLLIISYYYVNYQLTKTFIYTEN